MTKPLEPQDPVVIVGVPRSGVHVLAAILDSHGELASGPELPFVVTVLRQWQDIDSKLGENLATHHHLGRDAVRSAFRSTLLAFFEPRLALTGKRRFVIHSFGAMVCLDLFADLFPAARFILMVRDPRAVAVSLRRCDWRNAQDGTRLPYTTNAAAAARLWNDMLRTAQPAATRLERDGRLVALRYEDLCRNPGAAMTRIGSLLGTAPPQPIVAAEASALVAMSPGNAQPPPVAGRVDVRNESSRRDSLSVTEREQVDATTSELRRLFGYA